MIIIEAIISGDWDWSCCWLVSVPNLAVYFWERADNLWRTTGPEHKSHGGWVNMNHDETNVMFVFVRVMSITLFSWVMIEEWNQMKIWMNHTHIMSLSRTCINIPHTCNQRIRYNLVTSILPLFFGNWLWRFSWKTFTLTMGIWVDLIWIHRLISLHVLDSYYSLFCFTLEERCFLTVWLLASVWHTKLKLLISWSTISFVRPLPRKFKSPPNV